MIRGQIIRENLLPFLRLHTVSSAFMSVFLFFGFLFCFLVFGFYFFVPKLNILVLTIFNVQIHVLF